MKIQINSDYRIITDKYSWIVQTKKSSSKNENVVWKNVYYCNDLGSALRNLYELEIRLIDDHDIKTIHQRMDKFEEEIKNFMDKTRT